MKLTDELVGTIIVIVALLVLAQLSRRLLNRFVRKKAMDPNRKKVILNLHYIALYLLAGIALAFIWGVNFKDFSIFIASVLTVLGVGFFAQWSILSNLTASVILFFNHPMRIGDRIRVIDKDYNWVGEVKDISGFFVYMETEDGENISLPNSLVLQKGIEMLDKESPSLDNPV